MSKNHPYGPISTESEISLRNELDNTLYGVSPEVSKKQSGILRAFRRDSDDNLIPCPCVDSVTKEPDKDNLCPICLGEAKMWDEHTIEFYSAVVQSETTMSDRENLKMPGIINIPLLVFTISSRYNLTKEDKIVSLKLDKEGKPILPIQRKAIHRITSLREMRLDNGRLEFWKANCFEEQVKFL